MMPQNKNSICINIEVSSMTIIDENNKPYVVDSNSLYESAQIGYEQLHYSQESGHVF